jgi:protoheme IX farnesyltransferase
VISDSIAYLTLLKPRVMSLVVFTGIVGLWLAPGSLHPFKALIAILCIAVGSGAAGALNMWYERDIDALMTRTQMRPLPQGIIRPNKALGFALALAIGSVSLMGILVNALAAFYLAFAILFYVCIYTLWLKRRTPQNIVIGGAAGALPPVIETSLLPWVLFGIIFLWTPPHFWALALYRSEDYAAARIPMLTVVSGLETTKNHILCYSVALILLTLLPVLLGDLGLLYGGVALGAGLLFLGLGIKVKCSTDPTQSVRLFLFSIVYLFLLFAAMVVDTLFLPLS